ncbi:hypothetical protein CEE45_02275 [Candidatus Heimdallarchaeota archaeon B3_Heim]|nr:MAG: hypothetical protein CEE45_02275 [Candidatus Heimdallarchaeota archaeon B3_Heim]
MAHNSATFSLFFIIYSYIYDNISKDQVFPLLSNIGKCINFHIPFYIAINAIHAQPQVKTGFLVFLQRILNQSIYHPSFLDDLDIKLNGEKI